MKQNMDYLSLFGLHCQNMANAQNAAYVNQFNTANAQNVYLLNRRLDNAFRTPRERRLDRAKKIAAEVRARHPEMQVKRLEKL